MVTPDPLPLRNNKISIFAWSNYRKYTLKTPSHTTSKPRQTHISLGIPPLTPGKISGSAHAVDIFSQNFVFCRWRNFYSLNFFLNDGELYEYKRLRRKCEVAWARVRSWECDGSIASSHLCTFAVATSRSAIASSLSRSLAPSPSHIRTLAFANSHSRIFALKGVRKQRGLI